MTETDTTNPLTDADLREALDAITAAWPAAQTPPELRAACETFVITQQRVMEEFRAIMLVTMGCWLDDMEDCGHDRHMLEVVCSAETQRCVAMMIREVRERRGEAFVPGRMAIVAYYIAQQIAEADGFKCDIRAATARFRSETAIEEPIP